MCIAIVKPAGKWVTKEHLHNSFNANRDGAGYAYLDEATGKIVIKKGFFEFEAFFKSYSADVTVDTNALIHFRISTKGLKNADNCHPFAIDNGALMHNGPCLNWTACNGDKERSDTRQFAEDFVKTLSHDQVVAIRPMIEHFIGGEKVAFLFENGEFVICNEKNGQWHEGCWYSNSSFRGYVAPATGGYSYSYGYTRGNSKGGTPAATGGTKGGTPSESSLVRRSFGPQQPLFDCRWSVGMQDYVPIAVVIDKQPMIWAERFQAYIPLRLPQNKLSFDKRYVYQATDAASTKPGGPDSADDADWVIVGDCLANSGELRVFLREAEIYVPLAKEDNKPEEPPAATPAATNTAADASAAASGSSVH